MNKLFSFILGVMLLSNFGCDDPKNTPTGPPPPPPLVGCEAATMYDWESVEFETSLDGGADAWIAFSLEEITYFTVVINHAGFQVSVFSDCEGEIGLDPPLFVFETIGNGIDIGIVPAGEYWVNILNTRPNRMDFTFRLELSDIVYGCMDGDALNYDETANVDAGNCEYNDCNTDYYIAEYDMMVSETSWWPLILDCDGNCGPDFWVGDGWCDDGAYAIYDENGEVVPINFYCEEMNWDEGDCEEQPEGCTTGLVEDCNDICGPESWIGDGYCDDGTYTYNGNPIYFNCEEFENDGGDCDGQARTIQTRPYPNGRILMK